VLRVIFKTPTHVFVGLLQLVILSLCFLGFSSFIEIFPWYDSLGLGALILLCYMLLIQLFTTLVFRFFKNSISQVYTISSINLGMLLSLIPIAPNISLLISFAILYTIIDGLLIIYLVLSMFGSLVEKLKVPR